MSLVVARDLVAGRRGVPVVHGLSLRFDAGEVLALLGPNGAGKTTVLLTVAGLLPALGGDLEVLGEPVVAEGAHRLARRGLALVPENRGVFCRLTVAENLRLGRRRGSRGLGEDEVMDLFPALGPLRARRGGLLSGGEQQMLGIAKALVAGPRVLMIDEMSLGLAPIVVSQLLPVIRSLASDGGMGVVLVEQHVSTALRIADRVSVLSHGRPTWQGPADELARHPELLERSYLGSAPPVPAPVNPVDGQNDPTEDHDEKAAE
jgi:branched-chain amino acid transport system ATP-binding protein